MQAEEKEETTKKCALKLHVLVKKIDHEIKTILKDAAILLKMNMRAEFPKAELVDRQVLIHCNGTAPKTPQQARRFLGPMVNLLKISFESKQSVKYYSKQSSIRNT